MQRIACCDDAKDYKDVAAAVDTAKQSTFAWSSYVNGVCAQALIAKADAYVYKLSQYDEKRALVAEVQLPDSHQVEDVPVGDNRGIVKLQLEADWVRAAEQITTAVAGAEVLLHEPVIAQQRGPISDACDALVEGARRRHVTQLTKLVVEAGLHDNEELLDFLTSDLERDARMLLDRLREWQNGLGDVDALVPIVLWMGDLKAKDAAQAAIDDMRSQCSGLMSTIEASYVEFADTAFFDKARHANEFWQNSSGNWHTPILDACLWLWPPLSTFHQRGLPPMCVGDVAVAASIVAWALLAWRGGCGMWCGFVCMW